ncbi:CAP domain-containing protein [filamentous cyanobacterium LEGE 11480]|uniref:CAP domain-containing protein n=1 Tax=Romeriopsis navalis LEGE 11480 TaxID=2777977 RepID=A0A928VR13_9CYAN|nr:CAP domain-containing protein [Romeriopsis navalis]MBE9030534.1 CAP domain-containing protein [Romeriopsis navalis LEGE 11480]
MKYSRLNPQARHHAVRSITALVALGVIAQFITATPANANTRWRRGSITVPTETVPTVRVKQTVKRPAPKTVKQIARSSHNQSLERRAHAQINRYRTAQNLPPLQWSEAIATQARKHSEAMAQGRTPFSHQGFSSRVRATRLNFRSAAENVGYNQGYRNPVDVAVKGWLRSPGHKRNIEGDFNVAGIGVSRNSQGEVYFTQVFLKSR